MTNHGIELEIPTIISNNNSLSYVLRDDEFKPIEIFEKKVISNEAIIGLYKVSNFSIFFDLSIDLLEKYKGFRSRVFYTSDVVNAYLANEREVVFETRQDSSYYKVLTVSDAKAVINF